MSASPERGGGPERSPAHPVLVAPVGGFAAFVIATLLDGELPERMVRLAEQAAAGRLHPDRLLELRLAWAAIRDAGRQWQQWRASVDGTAEPLPAETPEGSNREREIDTAAAGALLGVSDRRVRQLAATGDLAARRVGRAWLIDRSAVELRRGA